jgi:uncharacterized membrane protein (DUF485 family)
VDHNTRLHELSRARFRIAAALTAVMMVVYFGFIVLVAYAQPFLAKLVTPGLSLGILLGALVIVLSWILTWIYVRWANVHYDPHLAELRERDR